MKRRTLAELGEILEEEHLTRPNTGLLCSLFWYRWKVMVVGDSESITE